MLHLCVAARSLAVAFSLGTLALAACSHSAYTVRPVASIAADTVGKPVERLEEAFGAPRRVDSTPTQRVYVWFLEQSPPGAPVGFHGCDMEVTVDIRSQHVLGYSLANVGWGKCRELERKIRIAER
jgi:hypothetical protein